MMGNGQKCLSEGEFGVSKQEWMAPGLQELTALR